MKRDIEKVVEIPEDIEVNLDGTKITVKKEGKQTEREFEYHGIVLEKKEKQIIVSSKKATKREAKMVGTIVAHITNMIRGVGEGFVYVLEICNVHFPMNVKVEGDKVVIKSFLGESVDRFAKILPNVEVKVEGNFVNVESYDKELAGQTAANIEKATKVTGRDRRIFQDGIFIVEKPGRRI